ncbi:contact-dependent growth inhibition system immunity protein [Microvirga zambiensis]|uniref:contact-dependent growth inhibition system immunity protein n=1 Tax=Microvirga zambiensis TaxID=1402137 RepID=UPI00191E075A|nr:contact-dependent growth inhibition system immunity protein [Microvirga zambiensis]
MTRTDIFDRSKSLEELEGVYWLRPDFDSYVVRTTHALRRKPLKALTVEEVRLGIGQEIGLPYLVPIALEWLKRDPGISGDSYEGDLFQAVLHVPKSFWTCRPDLREWFESIAKSIPANDT